jgi:diguanylate cyclase (GGDEF)-like protein/PAS domain S-box-containing protein
MKNFLQSITTRLALSMILITVVPIVIIAYTLHYQKKEEVTAQHLSNLRVIFKQTISTINTNINYHKQLLSNIAAMPKIAEKLSRMESGEMIDLDPSIESYVRNVIHKYDYYDFFIITREGNVVYTYKREEDYGKNINGTYLQNTALSKVSLQALSLLDTAISSLEYYPPSKRKSSFIATPIIVNQKILGVIAVQLNENYIFDLVKNYNGLGESGEVVAGAMMRDGRIVAAIPLKYDPDAFTNERVLNTGPKATGMKEAVQGRAGEGEIVDYRGVESIAVWGYEPTLKWGIVVKTDKNEVLSTIYKDEKQLFYALTFVLLGIAGLIVLIVKFITQPINNLIIAVRSFRTVGTFDLRSVACSGEIGYLSEEFNAMVQEIQSYQHDLESKIDSRTRELQIAKREIEKYVDIIDRFVIISITDVHGKILYASKAFEEISRYPKEELIGNKHCILKDSTMPKELFKDLWQTIKNGHDWHGEIQNVSKDGREYWVDVHITPNRDERGEITGYTAIDQDITDKKKIEEISITDALTGLYNRRYLDMMLAQFAQSYDRYQIPFSVIMMDLDNFKSVNDIYGHQMGDEVLQTIAEILKQHSRNTDVVGRWGGEEFMVLLPNLDVKAALNTAEKFRSEIERHSFHTVGHKTASFGVSEYSGSINEVIRQADNALYTAKSEGRNRVIVQIN